MKPENINQMIKFALISSQGTACEETCLCAEHATPENKALVETEAKRQKDAHAPLPGWYDVSDNDACICIKC